MAETTRWEFDGEVAAVFDDMLRRSIPQYELMRATCFDLGCHHVQKGTSIIDLGCSRGEALAPFVDKFGAFNSYVGVEISKPMIEAARQRFNGWLERGIVSLRERDLRDYFPPTRSSLVLSILTLQFTPIEYRQRIVASVYESLLPGGAFILVEKVLGGSAKLDQLMVDIYYRLKMANGYTSDEIQRKRLSLEGVLVPVTARWNEDLLRDAGFRQVDCFWRWMNFAGWIATKDPYP